MDHLPLRLTALLGLSLCLAQGCADTAQTARSLPDQRPVANRDPVAPGPPPPGTTDAAQTLGPPDAGADEPPAPASPPEDASMTDATPSPEAHPPTIDEGPCGALEQRAVVTHADGSIVDTDTLWTCDELHVLLGRVFVGDSSLEVPTADRPSLRIEAGTHILGAQGDRDAGQYPGVLVVTRSGRLDAVGSADAPIVFTAQTEVGARRPGDWGGVVLLGRATIGVQGGEADIEGLPDVPYGAPQAQRDDAHDCGHLRFVRIEFAGFEIGSGNELNGLTLGGCGHGTVLDYIQVHRGDDDGIEFFGGSADLRHALITGAQDDSIDWDQGYRGRMQFVAVQQHPESPTQKAPDRGIEGDGAPGTDLLSVSSPRISNLTLLGPAHGEGGEGMYLRRGTHAHIRNAVIAGFRGGVLDIEGEASLQAVSDGTLQVTHSLLVGAEGTIWPSGDQDVLDEQAAFTADDAQNRVLDDVTDLQLLDLSWTAPDLRPAAGAPATRDAATPEEAPGDERPAFFDPTARFIGAFEPGGLDWTHPWAAFPED